MDYWDALRQAIHRLHSGNAPEVGFHNLGLSNPAVLLWRRNGSDTQYGVEARRRAYEIV